MSAKKFAFDSPDEAIAAIADRLSVVGIQSEPQSCLGRVLAQSVTADRDSPAADVSAMDGYAIRMSDLRPGETIPVHGESAPGTPPPTMSKGSLVRIFTGAIVPNGADAVVKREDTEELENAIRFRDVALSTQPGENIRRAGENAKAGSTVLPAGVLVNAAHRATMVNFGGYHASVYSSVRVTVITTGDEVGVFADEAPQPWQLRNSNQVALGSLIEPNPWISIQAVHHVRDDRETLQQSLVTAIDQSDAILMTGGVSMGDYDYVPDVVREVGGDVVFHGLPIRPGKPILGAATANGKLILGLPGNPVSAVVGCRRFALPLLAKQSGQTEWNPPSTQVRLRSPGTKTLPLHWLRIVKMVETGIAEPVFSQGSGDLVSLGQSSGFVEVPANESGEGPWSYFPW
ncbi:molybdopterin biosynthesis protein MoeA [Rhodopirellula maiorica SM1]|uniref:Molybdopterin molybdenumtransferase n=1 Tax=Rhodopirellula maiorica SM1 TaxID=1265738 RepID=M5S520_9BACT|nr:molybdopterin molybdotransferase MoeA [Rhodopirellula maiorica]EMI22737.1 molybdopterin biosynthesis protein MoeA [Rhodopirellula maiorica SM1]